MNKSAEHIAWTKERALQELHYEGYPSDAKRISSALTSLCSDIGKDGAVDAKTVEIITSLATMEIIAGTIRTVEDMERWINGIGGG